MKKIAILIVILILIGTMLVSAMPISATSNIQSRYTFSNSKDALTIGYTFPGRYFYFAFKVAESCTVQSIDLWTISPSGDNCAVNVTIQDAETGGDHHPTGNILTSAGKAGIVCAINGDTNFGFVSPLFLDSGQWYGVSVTCNGIDGTIGIGYNTSGYPTDEVTVGQNGGAYYWDEGFYVLGYMSPYYIITGNNNGGASITNLPVSYINSTNDWELSAKINSLGTSSTGVVWFDYGPTSAYGYEVQADSSDGHGTMRLIIPKNTYTPGDLIYARAILMLQVPFEPVFSPGYNFSTDTANITTASLTTIKARETGNGTIYAGGVISSFGLDSAVKADIVYGLSSGSYPFETPIFATLKNTGVISSYTVDFPVLQSGLTIYYKAHIYGVLGGDSYGQEEQFNVDDYGVSNSALVQTLNVKDYSYNTATLPMMFLALGSTATSLDLSMWYSTSNAPGATYVQTDVLAEQTDVGEYDFKITGLTSDTNYYYYAAGHSTTGGVTTDVSGEIFTFRTKGVSGGGGLVDKGNGWLLAHGLNKNFWWVVVFVLMCLPWAFGPIREMPIVGIIIDVVALGIGVTMLFDPWVTVVIAIFAAVVVGGLFVRKVVKNE